jgi:DNA-binding YbaB/EbfC family protein
MFKGGMAGMMQKAKQMQEDMETVQKEITSLTCEGVSASGALKVEMNGDHQVTNIFIDETLMSDRDMLEDLIIIAVNDASSKISEISKEKMKSVTGGLNLPF